MDPPGVVDYEGPCGAFLVVSSRVMRDRLVVHMVFRISGEHDAAQFLRLKEFRIM